MPVALSNSEIRSAHRGPPRLGRRAGTGALLLALLTLAGCGGGSDDPPLPKPATVATVRVGPTTASVDIGATVQLTATTVDAQNATITGRPITWTSQTPATATVSTSGLVTGVAAGTVTVTATADGISGTASVVVLPPLSARCDAKSPIALGQTASGSLTGTDCRLSDDTYADKYELTLAESTPVRVLMNSASVDAYLILQDAVSGQIVAENDDGDGSTDARIEQVLPAGRYVIAANTFEANQFGDYRLTVARATTPCLSSTTVTSPNTINGTLAATACVLGDSSYADRYLLSVRSATVLTATLRSDVVDAFLFIESTTGVSTGRNDNSGGGTDARLQVSLDPGDYIINATSARAKETGAYSLILSSRIDPCGTSR
jgi:Bacterial Ig-like domain (group 2)